MKERIFLVGDDENFEFFGENFDFDELCESGLGNKILAVAVAGAVVVGRVERQWLGEVAPLAEEKGGCNSCCSNSWWWLQRSSAAAGDGDGDGGGGDCERPLKW